MKSKKNIKIIIEKNKKDKIKNKKKIIKWKIKHITDNKIFMRLKAT